MENNLEIILRQRPLSLFSQKDQLVCDGDKSSFAQRCLKDNVPPIKIQEPVTDTMAIHGGSLLC